MLTLHDPSLEAVEEFIDHCGFQLATLDLPTWYINGEIRYAFSGNDSWSSLVNSAPLEVAPGLASVLSSETPQAPISVTL